MKLFPKIVYLTIVLFILLCLFFFFYSFKDNQTYCETQFSYGLDSFLEGDKYKAIEYFSNVIDSDPKNTDAYFWRARSRYSVRNTEGALKDYSRVIEDPKAPTRITSLCERASIYSRIGEFEKALIDVSDAILLNPTSQAAFYQRGILYSDLGKYKEAINDYERAIEISPYYAEIYIDRGDAWRELGNLDRAKADYLKAQKLLPDSKTIQVKLSDL